MNSLQDVFAAACENLNEGELLILMASLRGWLVQTTEDPEVREVLGA